MRLRRRVGVVRGSVLPTTAVGLLAVAVAWGLDGPRAALGAAVGAVLALAFFGGGALAAWWAAEFPPASVMAVAMMTYAFKVTVLALFLVLLRGTDAFAEKPFAVAVMVCSATWLGTEIRRYVRNPGRLEPAAGAALAPPAPGHKPPTGG